MQRRCLKDVNILILVPFKTARGGITNYYYSLRPYFGGNIIYLNRGSKKYPYHSSVLKEAIRILSDYFKVIYYLSFKKIKLVQTTTAFGNRAIIRDAIFIFLAKLFGKKTIVFYRGWDKEYAEQAANKLYYKYAFLKTDASIVLSEYQKKKLLEWNYKGKIYKETTLVENQLVRNIDDEFISNKFKNWKSDQKIRLLFLARLERTKGIFELLEAFALLTESHNLELVIAGDGTDEANVKKRVSELGLSNVKFIGFVETNDKIQAYKQADIYIFPSYSEGLPNSVLEAMAFGLPVLTTPVGGLVDFFMDGINGFFIQKKDFNSIVEMFNKLIGTNDLMLKISLHNHHYAKENFLASDVAKRNEHIFQEVLNA